MKEQLVIRELLSHEITQARLRNPTYSLRAFARRVGMSASALSEILNGKRTISAKRFRKIAERIGVEPKKMSRIQDLFHERYLGKEPVSRERSKYDLQLSADQYSMISEWYHFGILSLLETAGARSDAKWIAKRLGITQIQAEQAIQRLERLELLTQKRGKLQLTGRSVTTSDEVASLSLRQSYGKDLQLASVALEEIALELRDFVSVTMAIDPEKLGEAKKAIRAFRDELCAVLESGAKKEVYKLSVQLFPLSKRENP